MKIHRMFLLLAMTPFVLKANDQITIEAKFIEAPVEATVPHDLAKLDHLKDFHLLSAPAVTTISGQQAQIELTTDYTLQSVLPDREKIPLGVVVNVTPFVKDDRISYKAQLTFRYLFDHTDQDNQSVTEITSHNIYVSGTPRSGDPLWLKFEEPFQGKKTLVWLSLSRKGT